MKTLGQLWMEINTVEIPGQYLVENNMRHPRALLLPGMQRAGRGGVHPHARPTPGGAVVAIMRAALLSRRGKKQWKYSGARLRIYPPLTRASLMSTNLREELHTLANRLPEAATLDDVIYELILHREIERGLDEVKTGQVISVEELRKRYG